MEKYTAVDNTNPRSGRVLKALIQLFYGQVGRDNMSEHPSGYHYKWFITRDISTRAKMGTPETKKQLEQLVKQQLVEVLHKGRGSLILWAPKNLEGYKQHRFKDYLEPITNNQ